MPEGTSRCLVLKAAVALAAPLIMPAALFAAATSVTGIQNLQFGQIAGGTGYAGTVTIDPAGSRFSTGTIRVVGGAYAPARFTITGNPGKSYAITLPTSCTMVSGPDQMTVTGVTSSIPLVGVIPGSGELTFTVGGTLTVNYSQQNKVYSDNLVISVK